MAGVSRVRGGRWPVYAVVAVLAIAAVAGAIMMERRTLASAVDEKTATVSTLVRQTVEPALAGGDLSRPVGEGRAAALTQALSRPLAGATVRVRVYARDGRLLYSTDEGDRIDSAKTGDADAVRAAAAGAVSSLVDDDRVSIKGEGAQGLRLLQVYAPVEDAGKVAGVAEFDLKYKPIEAASKQPWRTVQLGAGFVAILFLELALFGFARATATKRLAARSGFATPQAAKKTSAGPAKADPKAEAKEAEIRQALEDQLATLRTQMKKQEEDSATAAREFAEQLKATAMRAEQAEQKLAAASSGGDAAKAVAERASMLEQQLRQMEQSQQQALGRAAELETRLAETQERLVATEARAAEAERAAAAAPTEEPAHEEPQASEGSPEPAATPAPEATVTGATPLDEAVRMVRGADPSDGRAALEAAAAAVFPSVVAGQVKGSEVADALVAAAAHAGIDEDEARRLIAATFVARRSA